MTASTFVHSNAFNFLSFVEAGVDPRTGQYSCAISLPELKCNSLCGPAVPLKLSFNPLNPNDSGFGRGWNLALSQYDRNTRILSLSTGETFKVTGAGAEPAIAEKKIDSFHFYDEGGQYRVVHKSGLVEILTPGGNDGLALPCEIYSVEGHKVSLAYLPYKDGRRLHTVSENEDDGTLRRTLLRIERPTSPAPERVSIQLYPDLQDLATTFELILQGDDFRVSDIYLPTDNKAGWHFEYETLNGYLCIVKIRTPVGGDETVEYQMPGHLFPGDAHPALPRVKHHRTNPGFGQPEVEVRYDYSITNFLGRNADGLVWYKS